MQLTHSYFWYSKAFTNEECDRILEIGKSQIEKEKQSGKKVSADVFGNSHKGGESGGKEAKGSKTNEELIEKYGVDYEKHVYVRDSEVTWLSQEWIFKRAWEYINDANKQAGWFFDVDYAEPMQFTIYRGTGEEKGFYSWHMDGMSDHFGKYRYVPQDKINKKDKQQTPIQNMDGKVRKLSMTLNLNGAESYEGGLLQFDFGPHARHKRYHTCEEIKPKGSICVFPSFIPHQVTPVTTGTRYSLVMWCLGRPFK